MPVKGQAALGYDNPENNANSALMKFGKTIGDVLEFKTDFFNNNRKLLENNDRIAEKYKEQPIRSKCLICGEPLFDGCDFSSHGVDYVFCRRCGHLQGKHIETVTFIEDIYLNSDYDQIYRENEEQYWKRVEQIYMPKVDFLIESLSKENANQILDIGAGSGYFVAAARKRNLEAKGFEISPSQVNFGNEIIKKDVLTLISPDELIPLIQKTDYRIISAIGVLEHLNNLQEVLAAISENKNIKYIFFSVPMSSVSVLLESTNSDCFNRHLGGGHTHLFTNKSIDYISKKYGWTMISSWRFGSDIMDLYRMILTKNPYAQKILCQQSNDDLIMILDELQEVLDKHEVSSEKHFLFQIR